MAPTLFTSRITLHLAGRRLPKASLVSLARACLGSFGALDPIPDGQRAQLGAARW